MSLLAKLLQPPAAARLRQFAQARRTRRWGLGILAFVVLFGLFGFLAVPALVHHRAERQLSQLLSRPVSIGEISFDPYTLTLQARRVHIGERGGQGDFVDIGRLLVRVSWTSLLRLKPVVGEAYMDAPQVHLVRTAEQTFNFSDLVEQFSKPSAPKPADSKPILFYVANIHIDNGLIDFDDRLLQQHHRIDQLMFGVPFVANLPSKIDVFVEPFLNARVDGSPFSLSAKVKPFSSSLISEVALSLDKLELPPLLAYAPTKLPLQLPQGRLSTALNLRFSRSGEQSNIELSGTVDLDQLALNDAAGQPLFKLSALRLAADSIEPLRGIVHLNDLRIDQPELSLSRDRDGALNISKLAAQPAAKSEDTSQVQPAGPATPFDLGVQNLALKDGRLAYSDAQNGADLKLSKLQLAATGLSTVAHRPAHYTASVALDQGGNINSGGNLDLADKKLDGQLDVEQLSLAAFQPFLASALNGRLGAGSAGAKLRLKADWSGPDFALQLADSSLNLDGLRLEAGRKSGPVLALKHLGAEIRTVDLAPRRAELSSLSLDGLAVNAERGNDGVINLQQLVKPGGGKSAGRNTRKAIKAAKEPEWSYAIDEIKVDSASLGFVDRSLPQPATLGLAPVQLKVKHFSSDFAKPWQLESSIGFKRKGTLKVSGPVTLKPLKADLQLDGKQMDVAALEPYFTARLNATIASALLSLKGRLKLSEPLKVLYQGDAGVSTVRMLDKITSDLFTGWRSLDFSQITADYSEQGTRLQVGRITLSDFYSKILLNSNGQLNLADFMVKESGESTSLTRAKEAGAAAPAPTPTPAAPAPAQQAAAAAPPVELGFGQILLHKGKIDYTDNFIKPNFSAHLVAIEGDIGAFGTQSTQPARVAVQATLSNNGPVSINGTVNPLVKPPSLDMSATTRDVELTNFSAYSVKYAGYPIVKGKLNVDLHYQLDQNKLNANNHIFIDQFTFGDHVDSPTATNLPVRLAISLLKNSRGEIDVNVPVSGSLDDPQFSVGSLIWHAFLNVIEKAVTSPFSLLASAFGGSEELGYVAFDPGSSRLNDSEAKKLDTIAKALADKPGVTLDISGRVDPAQDTAGLKQLALDHMIKRQKIKDLTGKGESVDIDSVTVEPGEYAKYLQLAYGAADIKKPRNLIGLAKSIPQDQMKQLLLDSTSVSDTDLAALAQRRAGVVQEYFNGKVAAGRIYTVAPRLDASGISDKGPSTRVDFTLK